MLGAQHARIQLPQLPSHPYRNFLHIHRNGKTFRIAAESEWCAASGEALRTAAESETSGGFGANAPPLAARLRDQLYCHK